MSGDIAIVFTNKYNLKQSMVLGKMDHSMTQVIDSSIMIDEVASLTAANSIASQAEAVVQDILPGSDMTVHIEPSTSIV